MRSRWAGTAIGLVALIGLGSATILGEVPTLKLSTIAQAQTLDPEPGSDQEAITDSPNMTSPRPSVPARRGFTLRFGRPISEVAAEIVASRPPREPARLVPTAATAPRATTTQPEPPREFTIAATGDFLIHGPVARRAYVYGQERDRHDFSPMLEAVKPYLSEADLAICHLETPLSRDNRALSYYPRFSVPYQLAGAIAEAGYDTCSTASNHSLDKGTDGIVDTLDHLNRVGLDHVGTARSRGERRRPVTYDLNGITVGHLSYSYGFNGLALPANRTWMANRIDVPTILADARRARAEGAEFVILSLHWGLEYRTMPTADQTRTAAELLASGHIDLILGHHAHTVQPIDRVGAKAVVYGMGNFLSNQTPRCCAPGSQDGVIVQVRVREQQTGTIEVTQVDYVPTFVERPSYRIIPVDDALADPSLTTVSPAELRRSRQRTADALTSLGYTDLPARPN